MASPTLVAQIEKWKSEALESIPGERSLTVLAAWLSFAEWTVKAYGRCGWGRREFGNGLRAVGFEVGRTTDGKRVVRHFRLLAAGTI